MEGYNLKEVTEFKHHLMFNEVFGEEKEEVDDERTFLDN
jgi:hypothetical protein